MLEMKFPLLRSSIGKKRSLTDIDGEKQYFVILDEVTRIQSTYSGKILCLQLLQFENDKRIELRLVYYIIGKKPKMKGKWVWGQYASMMPQKDFQVLIAKAKKKGWI